jgi:FAD-dependent urate hydroxylase
LEGVDKLLSDGTTARGDFLVGADGVHSRVRQVIFPQCSRFPRFANGKTMF